MEVNLNEEATDPVETKEDEKSMDSETDSLRVSWHPPPPSRATATILVPPLSRPETARPGGNSRASGSLRRHGNHRRRRPAIVEGVRGAPRWSSRHQQQQRVSSAPSVPSSVSPVGAHSQPTQLVLRTEGSREEALVTLRRVHAQQVLQPRNRESRPARRYSERKDDPDTDCSPMPRSHSSSHSPGPVDVDHVFWWESGNSRSPTLQPQRREGFTPSRRDSDEERFAASPAWPELEEEEDEEKTSSVNGGQGSSEEVLSQAGLRRQTAEYPLVGLEELQQRQRHQQIMRELHLGFQSLGLSNQESIHLLSIAESLGLSNAERATYLGYQPQLGGRGTTNRTEEENEEEIHEDSQGANEAGSGSGSEDFEISSIFGLEALIWDGVIRSGLARDLFDAGVVEFDPSDNDDVASTSLGNAWTLVANLLMQWLDACQVLDLGDSEFAASLGLAPDGESNPTSPDENLMSLDTLDQMKEANSQLLQLSTSLPSLQELQPFVDSTPTLSRHEALVLKAILMMKEDNCKHMGRSGHSELLEVYPLAQSFYTHVRPKCLEYVDRELKFIVGGAEEIVKDYFRANKQEYLQYYWQAKKNLNQSAFFCCSCAQPFSQCPCLKNDMLMC